MAVAQARHSAHGLYVSVGDVVAGKYIVDGVLGVGGMGFVLSALHLELEERLALKFLKRESLKQKVVVDRFTLEAKTACKIRSQHVARVYDVGVHEGAPFIVMEHLAGQDLASMVTAGGALSVGEAVDYAMQTCEALAVAHSLGIIHRDIKPENLFVAVEQGLSVLKLLDFGISKASPMGGGARLTGRLTMGTPCYMAPEQIRSTSSADARSDLWSLGVVLYELLAGIEAFRATTVSEVCAAVLEREPPSLRDLRPDVPSELVAIVERCMEKSSERRFANVAELAFALLPFAPRAFSSADRSSLLIRTSQCVPIADSRAVSVMPKSMPALQSISPTPLPSDVPLARSLPPAERERPNPVAPANSSLSNVILVALTGALTGALLLFAATHRTVDSGARAAATANDAVRADNAGLALRLPQVTILPPAEDAFIGPPSPAASAVQVPPQPGRRSNLRFGRTIPSHNAMASASASPPLAPTSRAVDLGY